MLHTGCTHRHAAHIRMLIERVEIKNATSGVQVKREREKKKHKTHGEDFMTSVSREFDVCTITIVTLVGVHTAQSKKKHTLLPKEHTSHCFCFSSATRCKKPSHS